MTKVASVSEWIEEVKQNKQEGLEKLIKRYQPNLERIAGKHLNARSIQDLDHLISNAFFCFWKKAIADPDFYVSNRHQLFGLLKKLIHDESGDMARKELAAKRGAGKCFNLSSDYKTLADPKTDQQDDVTVEGALNLFESMFGITATPEQALVICLKLQGLSNREIARKMNVAPRTVTRWITIIRSRIVASLGDNYEFGSL